MSADLHPVGRSPATSGYTRFAWSGADLTCREWFAAEAARRALDITVDRNGNQWAWWGDPDAGDAVVTGSHLDSVPDGGAFDGPLGVVSGFAALDLLRDRGVRPVRPFAVVSFTDEEGARFGVPCAGSRLMTGGLDPDRARSLSDADGSKMAEAVSAAGHDPMLRLAAAVVAARDSAEQRAAVATIGKAHVHPGGTNAISCLVRAWLDARGHDEQSVRRIVAAVGEAARAEPVEESWSPEVIFGRELRDHVAGLLGDAPVLATGAGLDAGVEALATVLTDLLPAETP